MNSVGDTPFETRVCIDCGNDFVITWREKTYFESIVDKTSGRPLSLPKRCIKCRRRKNPAPIRYPREDVISSVSKAKSNQSI